jgi:hypothetical protein
LREIIALARQLGVIGLGTGIGEAIRHVERRGLAPFAEFL